jgi:hypothetical protein
MATVAYLLGAGASAQCIPVVNGMADDMDKLSAEVYDYFKRHQMLREHVAHVNRLKGILNHLKSKCLSHYSIDTYAKKLYLTDVEKFKRLKLDLSLYFTLRQILKLPDRRYDNFFSSIIQSSGKLPSKIKILSWNYDFQVERSYSEFSPKQTLGEIRESLKILSPIQYDNITSDESIFKVVKLNGSARIKTGEQYEFLVSDIKTLSCEPIVSLMQMYTLLVDDGVEYECELKFAWEDENIEQLFNSISADLAGIEVLVIIGYSFPFFNQNIDKKMLSSMNKLSKIYIQDLAPHDIEETMREIYSFQNSYGRPIEVLHKTNINQFVFPKELDITS